MVSLNGRTLSSEEFAGDVESFASHNNDLLAVEELFCDCAGETTEQVALAIDHDLIMKLVLQDLR